MWWVLACLVRWVGVDKEKGIKIGGRKMGDGEEEDEKSAKGGCSRSPGVVVFFKPGLNPQGADRVGNRMETADLEAPTWGSSEGSRGTIADVPRASASPDRAWCGEVLAFHMSGARRHVRPRYSRWAGGTVKERARPGGSGATATSLGPLI